MSYRSRVQMKNSVAMALVAVPPLILLGVGLTHPAHLSLESAPWWTTMHLLLVPLFPLLAASMWLLLRRDFSWLGRAGRVAAAGFAIFYGTLDAISGVATGIVTQADGSTKGAAIAGLFAAGKVFAYLGGFSLLASVIALVVRGWLVLEKRWDFWLGAALALTGAGLIAKFHIYFPYGTATLLALAIGFALLERAHRGSGDASFSWPPETHSSRS
jgi:uncharacterized membrane-anchored protein YitT (DUF2179 family)